MALARIAALALLASGAACLDPTAERTRRDLEETGVAEIGDVRARIEPGVALTIDAANAFVRLRANAPETVLSLTNPSAEERRVSVELVNTFEGSMVSVPATSVGAGALAFEVVVPPGGNTSAAVTLPAAQPATRFRFAWVGDVQGGNQRFTRIRARINADPTLELTLFAGDITEQGSQDEIDAFVGEANQLVKPWFSVLGNHESLRSEPVAFQRSVGRINVRFDYKGARFLLIDSASGTLDPWTVGFVREAMEADGPTLRIAAMHVPPFDPEGLRDGGWNDRTEAAKILAMLVGGGTDLLLAGHIHTLRPTSQAGIETWISGNGGVELSAKFDGTEMHYLAVTVDPLAGSVDVEPVLVP
jgi:Icc protein